MSILRTAPGGSIKWTYDSTANDSDKSFTVPTSRVWHILGIIVEITTTATAGNRVLNVTFSNGTAVMFAGKPSGSIAASKVGGYRIFFNGGYPDTTTVFGKTSTPASAQDVGIILNMAPIYLPAGYIIRVYDVAAIDAAADDMNVAINYIEYDA